MTLSTASASLEALQRLLVPARPRVDPREVVRPTATTSRFCWLGCRNEERRDGGSIGRIVSGDDGNLQSVTPAGVGKLWLLAGMVRATHPFRVVLGLSYALTAALGTAAFTVITNTIWQLSGALG